MYDGRSIPEIRGLTAIPRDRKKMYSAQAYSALYGITVELAEEILEMDNVEVHSDVERTILRHYRMYPLEFKRMLKEAIVEVSEEQAQEAEEYAKYHGVKAL